MLPTPDKPETLTASQALRHLRERTLGVQELAKACLARITLREPSIHAWSWLDPDAVLAQAATMDSKPAEGPLFGLPVGIKDVMLTQDMPTQYNSPLYDGFHPRIDAACVSLLRSAGALVFGKTETVEFASTGRPAPTCNPHELSRTPGGSSSGSAAAVADFHVPLTLGTQTGGSMIRPASFCGVYGIKPTWGLVNHEGAKVFAPTLDTIGWFARSAEDLLLVHEVFDTSPGNTGPFNIGGARIAVCNSPVWDQAGEATRQAMAACIKQLRAAGASIEELDLPSPFEKLPDMQMLVMLHEGGTSFLADYRTNASLLHPRIREQVENAKGYTHAQLLQAYDTAAQCRAVFDKLTVGYDAVLTPSTVGEAPLSAEGTGAMTFNAIWSLLHTPCINLPVFRGPAGLPVGLTLTGPRFSDRRLLKVALALGQVLRPE